MRASRLLRILLLLQNRGRLTSVQLAAELEVSRRTILRDLDALTEAGLPMVVHRGPLGGIELGFNYRTRLTGLSADEAEAIAVLLSQPMPALEALGMGDAARRARDKMVESFPDAVRGKVDTARRQFRFEAAPRDADAAVDVRLAALADAIRQAKVVRIQSRSATPRTIHPVALVCRRDGWCVVDALAGGAAVPLRDCGDINISARRFAMPVTTPSASK